MPKMNGYQFYSRVRDRPEWLMIPFIFLTAKEEVGDVRYGRELGAEEATLMKPFETEEPGRSRAGGADAFRAACAA